MAKAKSKNRLGRKRLGAQSRQPSAKTPVKGRQAGSRQHRTWPHRFFGWIATANKAVLAAIGAGLIAAITASVAGVPHLLAEHLSSSPPLTVANGSPPASSVTGNPCELQGTYIEPGTLNLAQTLSTKQVSTLVPGIPADLGSTSGTDTVQAQQNDTVVITAIHTVVLKRIPAPRVTVVDIESGCAGAAAAPPPIYDVSVNLDASNLTPKVKLENGAGIGKTALVHGLQAIVTNGSPIIISYEANTSRYDVTWELRIDYTINGQQKSDWIENGSQPFQTIAEIPSDRGLRVTPNSDLTSWTANSEKLQLSQ